MEGRPREGARWVEHRVSATEAGRSVKEVLTGVLGVSGRMVQRLSRSGGYRLNRRPTALGRRVREGDVVAARVAAPEESTLPPVRMELRIVHEDADVVVVDKPPFLLVHPVAPHHTSTLAHGITHHFLEQGLRARVRPVHRLDRDTSGLLLVAKSAFAQQALDRQLRERRMRRVYRALVAGELAGEGGEIDAPIGRRPGDARLRAVRPDGEPALTRWAVVERLPGATLLELELETGRTHQIRVHLAHLGHPLLGDAPYGGPAVPGLRRQALHAARLDFEQPTTGAALSLEAALPEDLAGVMRRLEAERER